MDIEVPTRVGHYEINCASGAGAFSAVYSGWDTKMNRSVALKFVSRKNLKDQRTLSCLERELRISQRLSHKSIIQIYDTIFTDDYVILVMENLRCGTLTTFKQYSLVKINDESYLRWGKEILEGLQYLQERNISHHDIKPDNIGFDDDMNAKIFDFGLCEECKLEKKNCESPCGTPFYAAPEILTEKEYDGNKADIWSFGVTFHFMVTGELPFRGASYDEYIESFPNIQSLIENKCEGVLKEIVDLALTQDPNRRPSAKELLNSGLFDNAEKVKAIPRLTSTKSYDYRHIDGDLNVKRMRRLSKPAMTSPIQMKLFQPRRNFFILSYGSKSLSSHF